MSFREVRTFTESLRILGYNRPVSVDSFRVPNVELVADIAYWLVKRYEPSAEISFDIEREADRVAFFRRISEVVMSKSRIKLNVKKLYQSDGHAVQELLKITSVLKVAMRAQTDVDGDYTTLQSQAAQKGHHDAKMVRQLCTDLTNDGSSLFFLMEQEIAVRQQRNRVLSRATEVGEFERRLRDVLSSVSGQIETLKGNLTNLTTDGSSLEQKIEGKKAQLERSQKRLASLLKVRPAFMEEYERFEDDLQQLFVTYLEQYRNLEYLEHELAKYNRKEDELLAEQETKLRIMRDKLRKEELKVLRGESFTEEVIAGPAVGDSVTSAQFAAAKAAAVNQARGDSSRGDRSRPRAASGRTRPQAGSDAPGAITAAAHFAGRMANPDDDSDESDTTEVGVDDDTDESDDDDDDDDDDDSDDDDDDDDSDESDL